MEGQIKWKSVWWRRGRRGGNSSQKVSCQKRSMWGGGVKRGDGGEKMEKGQSSAGPPLGFSPPSSSTDGQAEIPQEPPPVMIWWMSFPIPQPHLLTSPHSRLHTADPLRALKQHCTPGNRHHLHSYPNIFTHKHGYPVATAGHVNGYFVTVLPFFRFFFFWSVFARLIWFCG